MTEQQLYLAIGLPSLLALIGILVNLSYFVVLSGRIQHIESRLDARIGGLESRLDARMSSFETKFDVLIGKVVELDNRLTRVEEQIKHLR